MTRLKGLLTRNKFIIIAFWLPVLLAVLAFAVVGIYPFGDAQIAVIDMYHQYVPFLGELQYKLQEGGSLFYTWNGAGGSNFWNLMAYYCASPLNLLLVLFPKKLLMEGVTVVLLIKIGLAGSFMAIYLKYLEKGINMVTVAFATLYALCSYVMAYYWCIMWMDAVALLPLCILGLHKIIDEESPVMYVVALAVTVFANYYIAIMVCIFIMFYYPILYFIKIRNGGIRRCAATTGKAVGYSLLGVAMAAVMLLPTYISMQNTYYISSDMPENWVIYNDALDVINQLLPYTELTFREGLPNLYCGLIVVIMLVLYAISETIPLREKALHGAFLLFMFASLNLNKLDFVWHGLHFPNQLPFRYTFVICFVLIGIAYRTILTKDEFKTKHLWAILAGGIAYYLIAQKLLAKLEFGADLFFYGGVAWLVLYCAVMILYSKGYLMRKSFWLLIVVLIVSEMATGACTSFDRVGTSYREGYYSNSKDIAKLVEKTEEKGFARTEMDYQHLLNNPAMYHYKGVSQFSSSINANTTALMEKIGMDGSPSRNRFNYNQTTPVANAMLNVKYLIGKNEEIEDPDFKQVAKSGYSRLYESKYPLSIGYMAPDTIRTWDTTGDNPFEVLEDYVRAATANAYDKVFVDAGTPQIITKNADAKMVGDGKYSVKSTNKTATSKVTLKYTAAETQKYYVFIESYNADYIVASNGNKLDDIEIRNDCGSVVNIGTIKKGKSFKITVEYPKGKANDITCYVKAMDQNAWDGAYDIISANTMDVTDSGDNFIEGTIDVDKRGVLVTSIPYDKGWKLEVDGQKRNIDELTGGVFISTPLDEGEHHIKLTFRPPGLAAGIGITVLCIIILATCEIIRKRRSMIAIEDPASEEVEESPQEEADCN